MKQKNLVLMVVAVGCGLVAAFLTSQMSGRTQAGPPMADIVVAAKELPPGTKFTKESVKDLLKTVKRNPDSLPQNVVSEEELEGKTLIKTLRADDHILATDLGVYEPLKPPAGKELITVKLPIDKMTPFVKPTSRIDLLGTIVSQQQKVRGTVLIPKMLVMAIDVQTMPNPGNGGTINIQMVTLAASQDEAKLIRMAEMAGVNLSFILLGEQGGTEAVKDWSIDQVIKWINDATLERPGADLGGPNENPNANPTPHGPSVPPAPTTVKVLVPAEDLDAGLQLSSEVLDKKFKEVDWPAGNLPDNAVTALREKVGKYLVKPVSAGFPVPKSAIGDRPPVKDVPPDAATPKADGKPEEPKKEEKKKPTMDQTFQSPSGTKTYRYEQQESGKWRLLGEVQADGSVSPTAPPAAPGQPQQQPQPPAAPPAAPPSGPVDPRLT